MDIMQQNINAHKQKLFNLVNQLISTILVYQEININEEIKKESENLKLLLIIKSNNLINQNNINNNMNFNPFNWMTVPKIYQMNNNPIGQFNIPNDDKCLNVFFEHPYIEKMHLTSKPDEKVSELIKRYREKANDYDDNDFIMNSNLNISLNLTVKEMSEKYYGGQDYITIVVSPRGCLKGGFKFAIQ